jgi:hypothetical protein
VTDHSLLSKMSEKTPPFLEITSKLGSFAEHLLKPNIDWFNENLERAEELANMLLPNRQGVSLRLADHLVVQYSREHVIMLQGKDSSVPTELWLDYRRVLSCTGKKFFDVFKRRNSIDATLLGVDIKTTVGQIVFLCWYQKNELPAFMEKNESKVRQHMQEQEKKGGKRKILKNSDPGKKKKMRAPSRSDAVKPVTRVFNGPITMTYT